MESLIIKCYGSLQEKLEKEKENLKSVEANIKKIIGRSVVDSGRQVRIGQKRNSSFIEPPVINTNAELWKSALESSGPNRKSWGGRTEFSSFDRTERRHRVTDEFVPRDSRGPPGKRKSIVTNSFEQPKTVFSRLSGPVRDPVADSTNHFPLVRPRHTISSQVFVPPVEVPSRSEALEVQRKDPNFRARNKRMFGALLGTLRQFKQDETKLKDRESKKARVEARLEEAAVKERLALRTQRESLFRARQLKYSEIRTIELRLARIKEHEAWAEAQKPLANFIRTKTEPHIFYLPKTMTKETKKLLAETKTYVTNMIAEKNKEVERQVEEILRQGLEHQEMDTSHIHHEEDEDQELEDAYHLGGKPTDQHVAREQAPHEDEENGGTINSSAPGIDEFGRDTSRRDPDMVSSAVEPTSRSRSERKRSTTPPSPRNGKRKKPSKKSRVDVTRIKREEDEERRTKKSKETDENVGEVDVKPKVVKKKQHSGSSESSSEDSAPSSDEEASDYYYEDSDSYDENKVIKTEKADGVVKLEKEDEGQRKEGKSLNGGEKIWEVVVKSEKNGDRNKEKSGERSEEKSRDADKEASEDRNEETGEVPSNQDSGENVAMDVDEVEYPSIMDPMDLNSISLPGE